MSVVMPPLLQSAQLKPDVTITSADSDNEVDESDDERFAYTFLEKVNGFYLNNAWKLELKMKLDLDLVIFSVNFGHCLVSLFNLIE